MTLPNLVIAGAPKCGTTSLFEWLADHPQVCGASVKETWYLVDRGVRLMNPRSNVHDHGLTGYEVYFRHCEGSRSRLVLEGTPVYLYQRTAPQVLAALEPPPQIIFILRNPADRVYSVYNSARNEASLPGGLTFRRYVAERMQGRIGEDGDDTVDDSIQRSQYIDHLSSWLRYFPRSHILILLFEELRRDKRVFMKDLAGRLRIDPAFYDGYDFPYMNPTHQIRRPALHRMLQRGVRVIDRSPDGRARELLNRTVGRAYAAMNIAGRAPTKSADDQQVLRELDQQFAPYNRRLAAELSLDLSIWAR